MKIIVAGASHGVPEKNRACTSIFITSGENTYIIDAGADISSLLVNYGIPHKTVKSIMITHPHGDNFDGLVPFCDQLHWYYGYDECVPEFLIPDEMISRAINSWLEITHPATGTYRRDGFNFSVYNEGVIFDDGVIKVTAIQNHHIPKNAYSFFVECEGKKIFFTGDVGNGFEEIPTLLGNKHYDLVFCEGAHHNPGTANDFLKAIDTDHLVIHHINLEREPALRQIKDEVSFKVDYADDGLTIEY